MKTHLNLNSDLSIHENLFLHKKGHVKLLPFEALWVHALQMSSPPHVTLNKQTKKDSSLLLLKKRKRVLVLQITTAICVYSSLNKVPLMLILVILVCQHWKYPERLLICWVSKKAVKRSYSSASNWIIGHQPQDKKGLREDVARC